MTDQNRTVCSMPAFTEDEAKTLFIYHLQMASHLFELLPEGYQLPKDAFDEYSLEAAQEFLSQMEGAYQFAESERSEGEDGCC